MHMYVFVQLGEFRKSLHGKEFLEELSALLQGSVQPLPSTPALGKSSSAQATSHVHVCVCMCVCAGMCVCKKIFSI